MKDLEIIQQRYVFGKEFTISLLRIDGLVLNDCKYILEDCVREVTGMPVIAWKIAGETAIPVGRYEVVIDMSTRFKKFMLHLLNVPGFDGIRVHAGNSSHDTEGCLITGKYCNETEGEVSFSGVARDVLFAEVQNALKSGRKVYWSVKGLPNGGSNVTN